MAFKRIKIWIASMTLITVLGIGVASIATPVVVFAASDANPTCAPSFLSFPVWYRGLTKSSTDCTIVAPGDKPGDLSNYIWHIVLNCIDIALQAVGYIAAFLILYGGFLFLTSSGEASGIQKAKTTITNAVIGLVISIVSVAIVNLIFGIIN
jgi:hypothetical protein